MLEIEGETILTVRQVSERVLNEAWCRQQTICKLHSQTHRISL